MSKNYAKKVWTNHERGAAQERALRENREYILPARFDDTSVPGLRTTIGYLDLSRMTASELARIVARKLGTPQRADYLPPEPDLLFRSYVSDYGNVDLRQVHESANHFLEALRRTNPEERDAIILLFMHGCPADLPENIHINVDLLARMTGASEGRLVRLFASLRSLGFYSRSFNRGKDGHHIGEDRILSVEWHDMRTDSGVQGNATSVAHQMMSVTDFTHCDDCALTALRRLDFSHLSSSALMMETRDAETGRLIANVGRELRKLHPMKHEISAKKTASKKTPRGHS